MAEIKFRVAWPSGPRPQFKPDDTATESQVNREAMAALVRGGAADWIGEPPSGAPGSEASAPAMSTGERVEQLAAMLGGIETRLARLAAMVEAAEGAPAEGDGAKATAPAATKPAKPDKTK